MNVLFSKKCELGLQAVLFLTVQPKDKLFNAKEISDEIHVPKEFVSKVLQQLAQKGIVGSKKGKNGGFFLAQRPNEVRLINIVEAIDGLDMFSRCVLGFKGCSVDTPCPVHDKWGKLRNEAYVMLSEQTLDDLKDKINIKIESLIKGE